MASYLCQGLKAGVWWHQATRHTEFGRRGFEAWHVYHLSFSNTIIDPATNVLAIQKVCMARSQLANMRCPDRQGGMLRSSQATSKLWASAVKQRECQVNVETMTSSILTTEQYLTPLTTNPPNLQITRIQKHFGFVQLCRHSPQIAGCPSLLIRRRLAKRKRRKTFPAKRIGKWR